jgi:hypothetical protein
MIENDSYGPGSYIILKSKVKGSNVLINLDNVETIEADSEALEVLFVSGDEHIYRFENFDVSHHDFISDFFKLGK